jgi:hypothetical protein
MATFHAIGIRQKELKTTTALADSRFAFSLLSCFNGTLTRASLRDLSQ